MALSERRVRIRFIRVWGHPTKYQIWGPSDGVVEVTEWQAERLIQSGYAVPAEASA